MQDHGQSPRRTTISDARVPSTGDDAAAKDESKIPRPASLQIPAPSSALTNKNLQTPPKPPTPISTSKAPPPLPSTPAPKTSSGTTPNRSREVSAQPPASSPPSTGGALKPATTTTTTTTTAAAEPPKSAIPVRAPTSLATLRTKPVRKALITDVVKPGGSSKGGATGKDYVYHVQVFYVSVPDDQTTTIRQTYEDFFDLHMQLIGHFPEEAGVRVAPMRSRGDSTSEVEAMPGGWSEGPKRIIPELPGQMMFVSEAAAKGRMAQLQSYIQAILALPPKISRSPVTLAFFRNDGKNALLACANVANGSTDSLPLETN
ncbi:PX domain-containing protein [Fimicolochytrium jonesii]|uniref:PX domain-containing protein n=1 Tax=Fimicolochytrium jonesii TaxID=1396493 RepID=UPI0022FEBC3F|nr:PX domain-containing protein [Fimicolochytrium jonesii]KAI8822521.1 Phox homologous domain-containing protein [Fimicolochytrium jonesii]